MNLVQWVSRGGGGHQIIKFKFVYTFLSSQNVYGVQIFQEVKMFRGQMINYQNIRRLQFSIGICVTKMWGNGGSHDKDVKERMIPRQRCGGVNYPHTKIWRTRGSPNIDVEEQRIPRQQCGGAEDPQAKLWRS